MVSAVEESPAGFGGDVLRPPEPAYHEARRVWNAMIDRRPELILRPRSTADVQAAVRHARSTDLEISVRGGGHSVVGHGVCEGGLMIDLSALRGVQIDPAARLATVQGGALLRDLDAASEPHALHVPAGVVSHTGVGGLALGGGEGWLGRRFGLTCDSLRRATVVTASGALVIASETDDSDLLWALRGGGGNFGIVTEFVFELYPLDPRVLSVDCFYSADDGEQVLRAFREIALDAPEETTVAAWVGTAGPWPFLPNELHGQTLVNLSFIHVGDPSAASGVADALRGAAPVIHESQEQMTFGELQSASDEAMAHGKRRYWKSHYLTELTDAAIGAFLSRGGPASSDGIVANASLEARGGAQARIEPDATAFANRDARFSWITMAAWDDPAEDGPRMGAARRLADAMAPHASGVYVNALADPGDATGLSAAYRPGHLARLTRLKARYDPDNAFHLNQNIAPQAG